MQIIYKYKMLHYVIMHVDLHPNKNSMALIYSLQDLQLKQSPSFSSVESEENLKEGSVL